MSENENFELETINKMYLELAQFATATTAKEQALIDALLEARRVCKREIEITEEPNFADEHEYALEKIEQALKKAGCTL